MDQTQEANHDADVALDDHCRRRSGLRRPRGVSSAGAAEGGRRTGAGRGSGLGLPVLGRYGYGDGKKDLLVGQFSGGKIRVYRNLGDGKLAAGDWLKADGAVAEIPGVW